MPTLPTAIEPYDPSSPEGKAAAASLSRVLRDLDRAVRARKNPREVETFAPVQAEAA